MKRIVDAVGDGTERFLSWVAMVCMGLIALFASVVVINRYLFKVSLIWMEDVLILFVVIGVLLYSGVMLKKDQHITVGVAVGYLPSRMQAYVSLLVNLICTGVCIFAVWAGVRGTLDMYRTGQLSLGGYFPHWVSMMFVPLGFSIMAAYYLWRLIKSAISLHSSQRSRYPKVSHE